MSTDRDRATNPGSTRAGPVLLSAAQFATRFRTGEAVPADFGSARLEDPVMTLAASLRPRRVLVVGPSSERLTNSLCVGTPADAVVLTCFPGIHRSGSNHKALLIPADPREYDFQRHAPLDLAVIDGDPDIALPRSTAVGVYEALRIGGCLI